MVSTGFVLLILEHVLHNTLHFDLSIAGGYMKTELTACICLWNGTVLIL